MRSFVAAPLLLAVCCMGSMSRAQSASVSLYGSGCSEPRTRPPAFVVPALPVLGSRFEIRYDGPLSSGSQSRAWPWLTIGVQAVRVPIDPSLFPFQPVGCELLLQPIVVYPMPPPSQPPFTPFLDRIAFDIPADPVFAGFEVLFQWWMVNDWLQGSQYRRAIWTSDGLRATLGF